jgi:hypothetical protein
MRQSLADATGLSERREAIVRVSFAASFPRASSCRIHAQSCSELVCLPGCFRDGIAWGKGKAFAAGISSRQSPGFEVESQGYVTGMGCDGSLLQFRNPGKAEDPFAVPGGGISAKGNRKQFEGAFLPPESETVNAAEDLIFAERCREDCGRRGNYIGSPERSEAGLSVDIEI